MAITRFGISLEKALIERFDSLIRKKGYANRSEAIRDLIRDSLVMEEWEAGNVETVGTITLVYSHHTRELADTPLTSSTTTTPLSSLPCTYTLTNTTALRFLL